MNNEVKVPAEAKPELPQDVRPMAWANKSTAHDLKHKGAAGILACLTTTMCATNTEPLYGRAELIRHTTKAREHGRREALQSVPVAELIEAIVLIEGIAARNIHTEYGHDYACRLNASLWELRFLIEAAKLAQAKGGGNG